MEAIEFVEGHEIQHLLKEGHAEVVPAHIN